MPPFSQHNPRRRLGVGVWLGLGLANPKTSEDSLSGQSDSRENTTVIADLRLLQRFVDELVNNI